jgi:DNA-binding transcriptional regulator YhcF (GntR family)
VALRISLDRDLPVSVSAQLEGQIEYGIASGALKPGEQLPSVRELAAAEGVAHVTVSHVYRALKRKGLITVRPGMGTYVGNNSSGLRAGASIQELRRLVDGMVGQALERAFTPTEISHMVTARLAVRHGRSPLIALIGVFGHATEAYAYELRTMLHDLKPEVMLYTIEGLRSGAMDERARVCTADMILTLANRVKEVHDLLPRQHPPVLGLTFVVHQSTVSRILALPRGCRLGLISTFSEFMPTMLQGVLTYAAPEQPPLCAVLSDLERVNAVLNTAEAVIYASGSEAIVPHLSPGVPAIEYLHSPEPASVGALRPLLERLATSSSKEADRAEASQTE